jgi:hypothetical protein
MMNRALFCIGIAVSAVAAQADDFDRQIASVVLLQNQAVQKELAVTKAQRDKLNVHATKFNAEQKAYVEKVNKAANGKTPPPRDQAKELKMVLDFKNKVLAVLTEKQVVRLRQISLQAVGVAAMADEVVAKRIGLNNTQVTKIRTIVESGLKEGQNISDAAMKQATKGLKNEPNMTDAEKKKAKAEFDKRWKIYGPPAQKKLDQIRTRTIQSVMALLTSGQTSTWNSLIGPTFKV